MLFHSSTYVIFLGLAYAGYWLLFGRRKLAAAWLIAASYTFFAVGAYERAGEDVASGRVVWGGPMGWAVLGLVILFVGSTLDYVLGLALEATTGIWQRRALLLASVSYYLGVLAFFKYVDFFRGALSNVLALAGVSYAAEPINLALPFGISFFTFETMSYTIDVYRREMPACRSYRDYLLFVSFFPHLVSGPIVRPHAILPQIAEPARIDDARIARALFRIAKGLGKKVIFGDYLAHHLVNRAFQHPEWHSSVELALAVYGYAFQLYADFSGYTDIALGSAQLFGFELPENFDHPYQSKDLQEFWRRWHISLSSWLRDYLYIPLGGSRGSNFATYRNLALTMVLGGLWHGSTWNFVVWGALHGGALAIARAWQRTGISKRTPALQGFGWGAFSWALTFHYVCFAWVFFKAPDLSRATGMLKGLAACTLPAPNIHAGYILCLAAAIAVHFMPKRIVARVEESFIAANPLLRGAALAAVVFAVHALRGTRVEPFVYGQF